MSKKQTPFHLNRDEMPKLEFFASVTDFKNQKFVSLRRHIRGRVITLFKARSYKFQMCSDYLEKMELLRVDDAAPRCHPILHCSNLEVAS
jgi:hypothetical protein